MTAQYTNQMVQEIYRELQEPKKNQAMSEISRTGDSRYRGKFGE